MPVAPHETVQLQDRAYDSDDDLEAAAHFLPSTAPERAADPAWSKPRPRRDWRAPAIGLVGGLLLGVLLTHLATRWSTPTSTPKGAPQLVESLSQLDSQDLPEPVRIHYRGDNSRNRRDPLLPPSCPLPVVFTDDERGADIVVLNTDSHLGIEEAEVQRYREERPWQKFALWGVESAPNRQTLERHFNHLRDGTANETAAFEMTCASVCL